MLPPARPPLLQLLLLAVVAAATGSLLTGCSGGSDADDAGPAVVATGPHGSSAPKQAATTPTGGADRATPTSEVAEVCAPYAVMVRAVEHAAQRTSDPEEIAAAIAPVMRRFAAQVAALGKPSSMSAATWAGVAALADRIRALPPHPTSDDIKAVQAGLTSDQRAAAEDAADWFRSSCGL